MIDKSETETAHSDQRLLEAEAYVRSCFQHFGQDVTDEQVRHTALRLLKAVRLPCPTE